MDLAPYKRHKTVSNIIIEGKEQDIKRLSILGASMSSFFMICFFVTVFLFARYVHLHPAVCS
jgi:hypothetical protein